MVHVLHASQLCACVRAASLLRPLPPTARPCEPRNLPTAAGLCPRHHPGAALRHRRVGHGGRSAGGLQLHHLCLRPDRHWQDAHDDRRHRRRAGPRGGRHPAGHPPNLRAPGVHGASGGSRDACVYVEEVEVRGRGACVAPPHPRASALAISWTAPYRPAVPPCCTARPQVATEYSVKCSYLELYNEEITDLLTVGADVPKVRSQGRRQGRWAGHGGQRGIVHGSVALCLGVNAKT